MKVQILDTSPPNEGRPIITIVEMPQCPAVDEMVFLDEDSAGLTVKAVLWTPKNPDYSVQIRAW